MIDLVYYKGKWIHESEIDWLVNHRILFVFGFVMFWSGGLY